ncbi:MAG: ROK family transcriptional regulator [Pseudomonadota bacterium]
MSDETQPLGPRLQGSNAAGMRARNERLALSLVRRHGALAKSEIARMTGLSAQTVSVIMRALENDGLLVRGEPVRGRVGQPSVPMGLAADGAYFLGLKIGRRSSELVLTDFLGAVETRARRSYPYPTPEATLEFACQEIEEVLNGQTPDRQTRLAGLGVAMPFFLWNWAQTLGVPAENMAGWRDFDMRAELAARTGLPVFLENDATAACSAELVFGPQEGPRDFLYFYIGYFGGGGVVLNGQLFSGRGNAGALGPLPVPSGDGGVRQFIDFASLYVLEDMMRQNGDRTEGLWTSVENWHVEDAIRDAWLGTAAKGLAHATLAGCSIIDFEAVKIDGWMRPELRSALVAETNRQLDGLNLTGMARPEVLPGTIGPDARALGAASLPLAQRFLIEG